MARVVGSFVLKGASGVAPRQFTASWSRARVLTHYSRAGRPTLASGQSSPNAIAVNDNSRLTGARTMRALVMKTDAGVMSFLCLSVPRLSPTTPDSVSVYQQNGRRGRRPKC